jgi:hypothetical protein
MAALCSTAAHHAPPRGPLGTRLNAFDCGFVAPSSLFLCGVKSDIIRQKNGGQKNRRQKNSRFSDHFTGCAADVRRIPISLDFAFRAACIR